MPENDWWIPLTFSYIGAMKIIHSAIYGSNYKNTCNYKSIHVRKRIFDHFSRFRLSTLLSCLPTSFSEEGILMYPLPNVPQNEILALKPGIFCNVP